MEKTSEETPAYPDSHFWAVEFMQFNKEGRPIEGTSWRWFGIAFNATIALKTAVDAMIDEKPPREASSWRCVCVAMDVRAAFGQKR